MYSYCWLLLAILLVILASAVSDPCFESSAEFHSTHIGEPIPTFCQDINHWFYNNVSYRINFEQSLVDEICGSSICLGTLQLLVLPCVTFGKKQIGCLDSPAVLTAAFSTAMCPYSDTQNNMLCYTSLVNQGVIDIQDPNSPSLLMPCLDAYSKGEDCTAECQTLLMNADCCFATYYASVIDAFVNSDGRPVFENYMMFMDQFWGWCDLTSPGLCPNITLPNAASIQPRNDNVTCDVTLTMTTESTREPTQSPGAASKPAVLHLVILFGLLIVLIL